MPSPRVKNCPVIFVTLRGRCQRANSTIWQNSSASTLSTTPIFSIPLFKSVQEGSAQRGAKLTDAVEAWGAELARAIVGFLNEKALTGPIAPISGAAETKNPWFVQRRASADGNGNARFLCSLPPGGEQLTGVLRSKPFPIPAKLQFYLAGHDGFPDKPSQKKNVVRLRLSDSDEVVAEKFPPRNDTAQLVSWELEKHAGEAGLYRSGGC